LAIHPLAHHLKRSVPVQTECGHQIRNRTVHIAPAPGLHPSKETEESVAAIGIEPHEPNIYRSHNSLKLSRRSVRAAGKSSLNRDIARLDTD